MRKKTHSANTCNETGDAPEGKKMKKMKAITCKKCGASNNAEDSKHVAFTAKGFHWCGHCGGKLVKA